MGFIKPSLNTLQTSIQIHSELCEIKVQMFLLSCITVILNQGQDHLGYYQNVQSNSIYYHSKFESNQSVNGCQHQSFVLFCFVLF